MPIEIVLHLRVGGKELELTESEARELFGLLDKFFGQKQWPQTGTWDEILGNLAEKVLAEREGT